METAVCCYRLIRRVRLLANSTIETPEESMEKTLGDVVRDARVELGLGLREFAKKLDKTPSYLSDIENDRRIPAENVIEDLAHLLNLDFDDLMARAGRLGEGAVRYMQRNPEAGVLFRRISKAGFDKQELAKLLERAKRLETARKKGPR